MITVLVKMIACDMGASTTLDVSAMIERSLRCVSCSQIHLCYHMSYCVNILVYMNYICGVLTIIGLQCEHERYVECVNSLLWTNWKSE